MSNSDIRSFFGGGNAQKKPKVSPTPTSPKPKRSLKKKRIVLSDDEDGTIENSKVPASKSKVQKRNESEDISHSLPSIVHEDDKLVGSDGVSTTPDEYFEQQSTRSRSKPRIISNKETTTSKDVVHPVKTENFANDLDTTSDSKPVVHQTRATRKPAQPKAEKSTTSKSKSHTTTATTHTSRSSKSKGLPRFSDEVSQALKNVPLIDVDSMGVMAPGTFYERAATTQTPGSKPVPEGNSDCLSGISFVITGILETLTRQEATDLIKQYGGKVTGAPSVRTDFILLGENAGPRKVETIKQHKIPAINEDGLFYLITHLPASGGTGAAAQAAQQKKEQEEKKILETVARMDDSNKKESQPSQIWTSKYAPTSLKDICGNKGVVQKLQKWLQDYHKNRKSNFNKPGPDGLGLYKAVLLSGPPGIGKTTAAHLVAKLEGYDVLELNASDTRSKRLLDEQLFGVTDSQSLAGYFGTKANPVDMAKSRLVLIMDEIDGMSSGDRGGVGQLNMIIKKSMIPIICICNDRAHPKLRPLDRTTFDLRFRRPDANSMRSRIMSIAYREGLKLSPQAVDQLVQGTQSDMRQIINLLSTYKLSCSEMTPQNSQAVIKNSEKHIVMKPWDICSRYLHGGMFHPSSKSTINDKLELYFNDHEFSYLMVQENYLNTTPDRIRQEPPKMSHLKHLELISSAANSFSDSDLVDSMIHGPQQHWSLMPTHALMSCVRPASFVAGSGSRQIRFTNWLGNNSKTNKLYRMLREIQVHMRLKVSANKLDLRQHYIPILYESLPVKLSTGHSDVVPEIIELMDEYYLNREDFDSITELVLPADAGEKLMKTIPTAAKSAFTRKYNSSSHPIAFFGSSDVLPMKGSAQREVPDVEDAIEAEDEMLEEASDSEAANEEDIDLSKDKFISVPKKPKKRTKAKAEASSSSSTSRRSRKKTA
ncbi:DNA replication factor C complex subunit Rfc1 [Schizosaccharomyces pombe]|uniref:Replication factor C subunit 1 n=1 Tax=Schizosaccharomyces pombe (strain 972 / ATCC 24843) TaxID=284812 RepID=RFC1_SCHPO|nr:DNA replication factor C complex subunit Rfc1 [Schizosaccharomyces pombe]O60182.1 RecName: Full=Replication factor C subunit 1; Short=Replication factor C1 [Schizosaccharomyces pombe 972h-]CAA18875.1 DNA replication factor C complex subunit Rfc1 [Schizosaccharomyces pombe]|eukprot:NP_596607.1 DNA replication factor C complex subunit Rfc1 [Schizosaccharomyces pombe]